MTAYVCTTFTDREDRRVFGSYAEAVHHSWKVIDGYFFNEKCFSASRDEGRLDIFLMSDAGDIIDGSVCEVRPCELDIKSLENEIEYLKGLEGGNHGVRSVR